MKFFKKEGLRPPYRRNQVFYHRSVSLRKHRFNLVWCSAAGTQQTQLGRKTFTRGNGFVLWSAGTQTHAHFIKAAVIFKRNQIVPVLTCRYAGVHQNKSALKTSCYCVCLHLFLRASLSSMFSLLFLLFHEIYCNSIINQQANRSTCPEFQLQRD